MRQQSQSTFNDILVPSWLAPIYANDFTYIVLHGGRGGGKSYCIADYLIVKSFVFNNCHFLCAREVQESLEETVYSVLEEKIEELGVSSYFDFKVNKVINKLTKVEFLFKGLWRRPNSIKGIPNLKLIWIDEASDISKKSWDILVPTMVRNHGCQMICTFNPQYRTDIIYKEFVENQTRAKSYVKEVSYLDNPYQLPKEFYEEAERLKKKDPEEYAHIYGGKCIVNSTARVFKPGIDWEVKEFIEPEYGVTPRFGVDFGFSRDPLFGVRLYIKDRCIYVTHEAVAKELDVHKTGRFLEDNLPDVINGYLYCDSASPAYISALRNYGLNAIGAEKGKNSIEEGVRYMKAHDKIYINPRCINLIENMTLYSHKLDRGGDVTRDIEDKHNDGTDAVRYALEKLMKNSYNNNYKSWIIG